jgi:uncharacterized repeat protein (TIGR03803 family)
MKRLVLSIVVCIGLGLASFPPDRAYADSTFSILHSFSGLSDGAHPYYGSLTLSGSTLYGMTSQGGSGGCGCGTIFQNNTDGSWLQVPHSFMGGANDGSSHQGSFTLLGSTVYGMTFSGGANNDGTIFSQGVTPHKRRCQPPPSHPSPCSLSLSI